MLSLELRLKQESRIRRVAIAAGLLLVVWLALAYAALPLFWRHYEYQRGLEGRDMVTRTGLGIPGDAINFGLVGSDHDIVCAFDAAGWSAANETTLASALRIIGSVALRRPYPAAPVSPLFYEGRPEDLAFEKAEGGSADRRHHIRLWRVLDSGQEQRPVWLGAATFDRGVGLSHYTLQVTHHIAPDIDAERAFVAAELSRAGAVESLYEVTGVGPTMNAHNGGGDRYSTDGDAMIAVLSPECRERQGAAPPTRPNSWTIALKNAVWGLLRRVL